MASTSSSQDKATNVNLDARKPHDWYVNEIITLAYTKRSVDIANTELQRGSLATGYPADRYVLNTMEETGIFKLDTTAFISFCTVQVVRNPAGGSPFRTYGSGNEPCSFIEFLILNNMCITFREVIQHNDPVFRYPNGLDGYHGDGCYHFKVLMLLLGTAVKQKHIFGFLVSVPIQEEWKDPTWWEKMAKRVGCSPLYIELVGNNTHEHMFLSEMKRRLHYLYCNDLLIPMWKAGLLRWYCDEEHSIPVTEDEFQNEFHQNFEDYRRRRPFSHTTNGANRVRDVCKAILHQIWEFMVQLEAKSATESVFVPIVPLNDHMYMNTAILYPNVGDEVIYMGKETAYRGKQFQVVKCLTMKVCVLFNKTEVECHYVMKDLLRAVEARMNHLPDSFSHDAYHLPGNNVKLFTAATCDLQFVSEYTPKVGDYCTVSTHTFPEYMKHVVEITRIPDNENGDYSIANNSRPNYKETKNITVRYEGTKVINCTSFECEKIHVFTMIPDGKPLYVDMRKSYRSHSDVFLEDVELVHKPPSGVDMIIHRWVENWNYAGLNPYAQYQHKMFDGELKTFVAQYIPHGVRDCLLPATALESTRNDEYVKFEDSSCFDCMLHPGQQVEWRHRNVGLKFSGIIKYIVKHNHKGRMDFGLNCLDIIVVEREKTRNCPRSIRTVNRSNIVSVESPQPGFRVPPYLWNSSWILTMKGRAACNGLRNMPTVMTLNNFRSLLPFLTQLFKEDKGDIERCYTIRNDVAEHDVSVHDAIPFSSQIYACPVEVGSLTVGDSIPDDERILFGGTPILWEKDGSGNKRYHALHLCQYLCQNSFVHGQIVAQNRITGDRWWAPQVTYVEPTNARWPLKNETPIRTKIDVVRFLSRDEIHEHMKKYEGKRKATLETGKKRSMDNNGNSSGSSTPEKRMRFDKDALKLQQIEQISKMINDNKERLQALILRRDTAINAEHCDPQHLMRMCDPDPAIQQEAATAHAEMVRQLYEVNADIKHLETSIKTLEEKLSEKTKK